MSHEVETMTYTNEVPWHGLGVSRPQGWANVIDMLKDAGLNWKVEKRPMVDSEDHREIPGHFQLRRSSDKRVLDVCGGRYIPTQNADVFKFFDGFVRAGKAKMETAGSLFGGRMVWALARLGSTFKLKGKDEVRGYLLIGSPHQQGKSLIAKVVATRVVCNNTYTAALHEGGSVFRMNHRNEFDEDQMDRAKEVLGIARDQFGDFEDQAIKLQKKKMKREDVIRVFAPIFQPRMDVADLIKDFEEHASPRMELLLDVYERAPGAEPGTAWGAFNAVTYFADHLASRTPDRRLGHAWMGKTAGQKDKVLDALLTY
ncbi:MAG: DUF932 domain-containing protein [Phycisphaerales bacterium]